MTTKDTKTTKNGLASPPDSSIHHGIREAQLMIYTKLGGVKTGRQINFNVTRPKERIKRFVVRFLRVLRVLRGAVLPLKDRKSDFS